MVNGKKLKQFKTSRSDKYVKRLANSILNDEERLKEIANQSYKHSLGFTKLILEDDGVSASRIHYWDGVETNLPDEEAMHTHGFNFHSRIITGSLRNVSYEVLAESVFLEDVKQATTGEPIYKFMVEDKEHTSNNNGEYKHKLLTHVVIGTASDKEYTKGDVYYHNLRYPHILYATKGPLITYIETERKDVLSGSFQPLEYKQEISTKYERQSVTVEEIKHIMRLIIDA